MGLNGFALAGHDGEMLHPSPAGPAALSFERQKVGAAENNRWRFKVGKRPLGSQIAKSCASGFELPTELLSIDFENVTRKRRSTPRERPIQLSQNVVVRIETDDFHVECSKRRRSGRTPLFLVSLREPHNDGPADPT